MKKRGLNLPKQRVFKGPASIWKRFASFIIDILVINFVIAFPFQSILKGFVPTDLSYKESIEAMAMNSNAHLLTTISIAISILGILYLTITQYKLNQTIGMMLMNIFLVSEKKPLKVWQCLVRNLFLLPFIPFILLWIIDPLYMIFSKNNRRFSDIIAKTNVIEQYVMG